MRTRWAVVGTGAIATDQFAPAIREMEDSEIVAAIDMNPDAAKAFAKQFGVPYSTNKVAELSTMDNVDAVYIATWPSSHLENITVAAQAGKHILCEKPAAASLRDAEKIIDVCDRAKVKLMIGYMMRFTSAHVKMKELLRDSFTDKIVMVKADSFTSFRMRWGNEFDKTFRFDKTKGGIGLLMDMGIHVIDLIRFLTNKEIVSVHSMGASLSCGTEVEDTSVTTFQFDDGSYGSVNICGDIPYGRNGLELYSNHGALIAERSIGRRPEAKRVRMLNRDGWKEYSVDINNPFFQEITYFQTCIHSDTYPQPDAREDLNNLKVILAAYESMKQKRAISIER
ncbi:MAG: Gfo/Idh/MocA family protein [Syntrophales bacterium]